MINPHWYKTAEQSANRIEICTDHHTKSVLVGPHPLITNWNLLFVHFTRTIRILTFTCCLCNCLKHMVFKVCRWLCCKIFLFDESYKRPLLVLVNYCRLMFLNHRCLVHCFVRKRKACRMCLTRQKLELKIILILFLQSIWSYCSCAVFQKPPNEAPSYKKYLIIILDPISPKICHKKF